MWAGKNIALALLLFGLLAPRESHAAPKVKKICPDPNAFINEIYNCGQNDIAVAYAKACADVQTAESRLRGQALHTLMEKMKKDLAKSQSASMFDTQKRLFHAVNELTTQIQTLQKNTELVAGYTAPMIDFADGVDDKSSADCFNKSFHALQKIVNGLDQEIIQSKRARESAIGMLESLAGRQNNMNSLTAPVGAGRVPASVPVGAQPDGRKMRQSDVSGTEKLKKP